MMYRFFLSFELDNAHCALGGGGGGGGGICWSVTQQHCLRPHKHIQ